MERRAGNDIRKIREMHPRFRMLGAFDKTVMHLGGDAVREEFERILPVLQSGGYVSSVDHQTPPEVSLEDYRRYVRLLREYCERAGSGWQAAVTQTEDPE
jgi:uroporphyrinogen-III decarboxylase